MRIPKIFASALFSLIAIATCLASPPTVIPKVIIDTDFNTMGDDGQVAVMAAQLYAQGAIDLLGFTIPTGNQWRDQEVSDNLKMLERMGIRSTVHCYIGAQYPLLHDFNSFLLEELLFGQPTDYIGAYSKTQPSPSQIVPPPDGFATHTKPATEDAVSFIIDTIHRYPNEVTILAIAPLTNIAMAMREDPTIIPLIKQIWMMGSQIFVGGNAYNDAGEFNIWMDPEAAQVVFRANVPKIICPLDVTNTVILSQNTFNQIANHTPATIVTQLYGTPGVGPSVNFFIFDTVAMATFFDPTLITSTQNVFVDVPTTFDANYGKTKVYSAQPFPPIPLLPLSEVVLTIDNTRFFALYTDLLTRPVPVQFGHQP